MEDIFGGCPHGLLRPYCPSCAGDEVDAKRETRRRAAIDDRLRVENVDLRKRVAEQSVALDEAYDGIRRLRRRLQRVR